MNILIVDDDVILAEALKEILDLNGHETTTAYDGLIALSRLEESKFDLVITDLDMPIVPGDELQAKIASDYGIPVILTSGGVGLALARCEHKMAKPYKMADLVALVNKLLA